ncbi:hypothetical protein [Flavobacterium sp. 245]|uniref:hypothetical protein n=1 Tax=Flavobacterium sp. 245 TaxID=2512115 RepID=UPI0010DC1BE5|nr:hypothetical protein [Flavobacterium sp. 245]TDP00862.1 CDP-glycerol:poly(glycerophosphate) glycerophosphotransferase [Flavobacterium sp. 245]
MMSKLGIVITDGVGFRNFMLSDFYQKAQESFNEVVILSCLPKEAYKDLNVNCEIIELSIFNESFFTWFFRKSKEVAHLQLHKKQNKGIEINLQKNWTNAKNPRGYATRFIFKLTSFLNSEKWIQRFNHCQQLFFKNDVITKEYFEILKKENFDLLFFTHQRPPFIAPVIYAAELLKVRTATFIFSWDNLASKGRMSGNYDCYLVWSDLMKSELLQFYPSVKEQQIKVVGTPQFEPYVLDRYKSTKEKFHNEFDLDPSMKTICFSCGDVSTSKNDELYIDTIASAITNNNIPKVNFLVRISPAEDGSRFKDLKEKYSFIKWNFPKWVLTRKDHQESWSQRVPTVEDVIDLRSILQFSDLNINMLSTMSLDFMCFKKPVINPVFGSIDSGLYNDQKFLDYEHIKNVVNSKSTRIAKNDSELISAINLYLQNPEIDEKERARLVEMQVSRPLENTGKRIAETLQGWA